MDAKDLSPEVADLARRHKVEALDYEDAAALLQAIAAAHVAPPAKRILKLPGDVEVDLTDVPPFTVGDRKRLKADGVDFLKYIQSRVLEPEDEAKMLLFIIRKRRPETTPEEAETVPAMVSSSLIQYFIQRSGEVDNPFSMRSTSSPRPTAGAPRTPEG